MPGGALPRRLGVLQAPKLHAHRLLPAGGGPDFLQHRRGHSEAVGDPHPAAALHFGVRFPQAAVRQSQDANAAAPARTTDHHRLAGDAGGQLHAGQRR